MITEVILQWAYNVMIFITDKMEISFDFSFDTAPINTFLDVLSTAVYFFPWRYVAPILGIIILLMTFRISMALLRFVMQFIPFIGGS